MFIAQGIPKSLKAPEGRHVYRVKYLAPEGCHVYSTRETQVSKAPEGRHVYRVKYLAPEGRHVYRPRDTPNILKPQRGGMFIESSI